MTTAVNSKELLGRVSTELESLLEHNTPHSKKLNKAIGYSLLAPSKKLRAQLVILTGLSLDISLEKLLPAACAIEAMHAYSLVHDDLPAMDNDDFRRGQLSSHKQFDEATAILVGDALQTLANLSILNAKTLSSDEKIAQLAILNHASGPQGMIDGQMLDLFPEGEEEPQIVKRHQLKTGALFSAAVELSLTLSEFADTQKAPYQSFAAHLGLAFQMHDDYLDAFGQEETLGKPPGSDKSCDKTTFSSFYTKEELACKVDECYQRAFKALLPLEPKTNLLLELCENMRRRGL